MSGTYRIFLSSPGDVAQERAIVRKVVDREAAKYADRQLEIELIRWEESRYTAAQTFQDQLPQSSDCDLVICVFWKRLGTELPDHYQRPDGSTPTGTEFEFEQAMQQAIAANDKTPDVLVYRCMAPVVYAEETVEQEKVQRNRFLAFWDKWFRSEQGHFIAGFHTYETPEEFEQVLSSHLGAWLKDRPETHAVVSGSPFRGLEAFRVEDAHRFFGRRRDVARARARLIANSVAGQSALIIVGASGSGKSSLIQAGLVSALMRPGAAAPLADQLFTILQTPSTLLQQGDWAAGLATALLQNGPLGQALAQSDVGDAETLAELFRTAPAIAAKSVRAALARISATLPDQGQAGLLLVLDQLEEVFAMPPDAANALGAALQHLSKTQPDGPTIALVCGLRSDFRHRLADLPALSELAGLGDLRDSGPSDRTLDLLPPGPADLRDIITRPAQGAGVHFETDPNTGENLAAQIEADARGDALPALQMLLTALYDAREGDMLTIKAYTSLGKISGVIARRAEDILQKHGQTGEAALPAILRSFAASGVDLSGGAQSAAGKQVARRVDINAFQADPAAQALVSDLLAARLLVSDDRTLRVAHEALLRDWPRAVELLKKDSHLIAIRDRLALMLQAQAGPSGTKLRQRLVGLDLAEGRTLLADWGPDLVEATAPGLVALIRSSVRSDRMGKMRAAAAGLLVMIAAGVGLFFWQQSQQDAQRAEINRHLALVSTALTDGETQRASLNALRAFELDQSLDTRSALMASALQTSPHLDAVIPGPSKAMAWAGATDLLLVTNGSVVRTSLTGEAQTIPRTRLSSLPDAHDPLQIFAGTPGGWTSIGPEADSAGPDGQQIPFSDAALWLAGPGSISRAANKTAFADLSEGAWLRTCASPGLCGAVQLTSRPATAIALDPQAQSVAVAVELPSGTHAIRVYDLGAGAQTAAEVQEFTPETPDDAILALVWAADRKSVAYGTRGGQIGILDLTGGTTVVHTGADPVIALDWSTDMTHLAAGCANRSLCLIHLPSGTQHVLNGHRAAVSQVAFAADGARLASLDLKGETRIWTVKQAADTAWQAAGTGGSAIVEMARWQDTVWAVDDAGSLRMWRDPNLGPAQQAALGARPTALRASRTGDVAIATQDGTLHHIDNATGTANVALQSGAAAIRRFDWIGANQLVAALRDGTLWTLDLTGEAAAPVSGATDRRTDGLTALPNGGFAASFRSSAIGISTDGTQITNLLPAEFVEDRLSASRLSPHPGGNWLAANRADGRIRLYPLTEGPEVIDLDVLRPNTKDVAFSPSGAFLAALDDAGMVYVWGLSPDLSSADLLFRVTPRAPRRSDQTTSDQVRALHWLDDDRLAAGFASGAIRAWDVRADRQARHLGHVYRPVQSAE